MRATRCCTGGAPDWVLPAPATDAAKLGDSAPQMLVFDQQQRLQDGETWIYFQAVTHIATPQMLTQSGTLPLAWDPSKGDLIVHKVQILRGAERIDLLAKGGAFTVIQREQKLEQFALDGNLTATMALEGLRVGDLVDVSFSISRKDSALGGQLITVAPLIAAPTKLQFGRLRLLWPQSVPLKWRNYIGGAVASAAPGAGPSRATRPAGTAS